jgi:hypothetical protein
VPNPKDKVEKKIIYIFLARSSVIGPLHFPKSFIFLKGINSETGRRQYNIWRCLAHWLDPDGTLVSELVSSVLPTKAATMFSSTPTSIPMHFPTIIKYGSDMEPNPLMEAL